MLVVLKNDGREKDYLLTEHGAEFILTDCLKECTNCGKTLPLTEFGVRKMQDGLSRRMQPQCNKCRNATGKARLKWLTSA